MPSENRALPLRRYALVFVAVVAAIAPVVSAAGEADERRKLERFVESEEGCVDARALDYLLRHGDYGRINPERLLQLTKAEKEARQKDVADEMIGGSVWTPLGPNNGAGRVNSITPHPTIAGNVIIGAAGGGAWKTTNGGVSWTPLTEAIPNLSVGAVSYAPSSPNIVYLGSGEAVGSSTIGGIGLLVSFDGGVNWTLPSSVIASSFFRISVHPGNANELVVATPGGALRSTGGQNGPWTTVLSGYITDLVRDPWNAQILYAASSHNPTAIYKSYDGGQSWSGAASGLPSGSGTSRWSLAIAPSNTQVLYALTSFNDWTGDELSHLYTTTNGGLSWSETGLSTSPEYAASHVLGHQSFYDNTLVVAPGNSNLVIAGGVLNVRSTDGGWNWTFPCCTHADWHDLRYDAGGTLWIANDGGVWTSTDHGQTFVDRNSNLVIRQFYAIAVDGVYRNRMLGGTQDNGTSRRTDTGGSQWDDFSFGDGFECAISPFIPDVAYSTLQFGVVFRGSFANAVPSYNTAIQEITPKYDAGANEYGPFFSLLTMDPVNPAVLYTGTTRLWKSSSGGDAWAPLPTTVTGGGSWSQNQIRRIAISPSNPQVLMVAKAWDIYRSVDGGQTWTQQTWDNGLPGHFVNWVEIDPYNSNTVYAAFATTYGSSVYRSTDGGANWSLRASGLPSFAAQVIRFDPLDQQTLYCGTDVGVYRTTNNGATWSRFGIGLPAVAVDDLEVLPDGSMLRAGTHGRGAWELNVTGITNQPPAVSIVTPSSGLTVTEGSTVTFRGSCSDANDGAAALQARWSFSDDWTSQAVPAASNVAHTFYRAGTFVVGLTATDPSRARGAAQVTVNVLERGDDCATPEVIPSSGPFPWSVTVSTETATQQPTDLNGEQSCDYPNHSVWVTFTPAVSGTYTFSLCGSMSQAQLAGFTGAACGPYTPQGLCLYDVSRSGNCAAAPSQSTTLTANQTYRLRLETFDRGQVTLTVNLGFATPEPMVSSIAPFLGSTFGGVPVTVTGSGFMPGASLRIGGAYASNVAVLTPNIITGIAPAHAAGAADVAVTNPSNITGTLGRGFTYLLPAPGSLTATASDTSTVALTWNASSGAHHYEIARSTGDTFTTIGVAFGPAYSDASAVPNTAYLYRVRAVSGAGDASPYGNADLAVTVIFSDELLIAGTTRIRAVHLTQLRTAVNAVRAAAGIAAAAFTDPHPAGVAIKAIHATQLRDALAPARAALGLTALTFARPVIPGQRVFAGDFMELRNGVK